MSTEKLIAAVRLLLATSGPKTEQQYECWKPLKEGLAELDAAPAEAKPAPELANMTAQRAAYFMKRFKREEKLLGPNEQAAVDFVLAMLAAPAAPAGPVIKVLVRGSNAPLHVTGWYGDTVFVDLPEAAPAAHAPEPLHITLLIDWLAARYRAAGGKEGITDLSAFCEEVMRWTENKHGITFSK